MIDVRRHSDGSGLTHSELLKYNEALRYSRKMYIDVRILDRNENQVSTLTGPAGFVTDGQVDVDTTQDVTRSTSIEVVDPTHRLYLDPSSPHKGALYPGQLVRIIRWDWASSLSDWIGAPMFWGPITRFVRKGHMVTIEGQGKESLYLDPDLLWEPMTFRKGSNTVQAIHDLLYRRGERRFSFPKISHKLGRQLSLSRHDEPWKTAQVLARSVDRQLYFDGRGVCKLRSLPTGSLIGVYATTRAGKPPSSVLEEPQVTADFFETLRNTIEVLGPQPSGKKKRIRSVYYPPYHDPLSPHSLAINGQKRYLVHSEEVDTIKRQSQADARAASLGHQLARLSVEAEVSCLPFPHLEENDVVGLVMEDTTITMRLKRFSLPLTPDGAMSLGANKRVSLKRRRA